MHRWKDYRSWILAGAALVLGGLFLCAHFWLEPWIRWEKQAEDLLVRHGRRTPYNPELVFLAIDPTTFTVGDGYYSPEEVAEEPLLGAMMGGWPWPRSVYAGVLERLMQAGARLVLVDILFPHPGKGDAALSAVVEKYADRVILAANLGGLTQEDGEGTRSGVQISLPSASVLASEDPGDPRLGLVNFWPDPMDSVVRESTYAVTLSQLRGGGRGVAMPEVGEPQLYSLAGQAARRLMLDRQMPLGTGTPSVFRFSGPPGTFTPHPLHTVVSRRMWERNFGSGTFFRGKVVLIGPLGNFFKDDVLTPSGMFPGAELHLHALNAAWHGQFLHHATFRTVLVVGMLAVVVAWGLCLCVPRVELRAVVAVVVGCLYGGGWLVAYNRLDLFLPALAPLAGFVSATAAGFIFDLVLERAERARLRAIFERYVSRNVVSDLLDRQGDIHGLLGGQRRPVTVLFADIRNFTAMAECSDSTQLVQQLNEYLTAMVQCVFEEGGTLDKFIGDAVMAVWGNVLSKSSSDDACRAIRCAVKMSAALRRLNLAWEQRGWAAWKIGIGLNHGDALVGNMGSPDRMEFTVIGDAVNLASRIEGLTKQYKAEILLGETLDALAGKEFCLLPVDTVQVKGKQEPVTLFCLLAGTGMPQMPSDGDYAGALRAGYGAFRAGHLAEAAEQFRDAIRLRPGDTLAEQHLAECGRLAALPPDLARAGIRVMAEK